jgi:hypothetical protein
VSAPHATWREVIEGTLHALQLASWETGFHHKGYGGNSGGTTFHLSDWGRLQEVWVHSHIMSGSVGIASEGNHLDVAKPSINR